jgi:peptidoglycan/LPS O-acetylase OafA/YrhL
MRAPASEKQSRHYELDWCRAFVVLVLIPFHAAGLFTATAAQYFSTHSSSPLSLSLLATVGVWGISLLFLIAGAGACFALERRSPREFISERCLRLLIPFAFATLTLIPLQDYAILHAFPGVLGQVAVPGWDRHVADSLVSFYPRYLGGYLFFLTHYAPGQEIVFWSHLYFIPRLLVISLVALPLLLALRSARGRRLTARFAVLCERHRGAVFLLALPPGLVLAAFGWQWQTWQTGVGTDDFNELAQLVCYGLAFVYGYLLYADERLRRTAQQDSLLALALVLVIFVPTQLPGVGNAALAHDYSAGGLLAAFLRALAAWLWVLAVIGLAMRSLAFTNRLGRYLTEASYPLYVLHLPLLYLLLLALPQLLTDQAPALLRYLAIVTLTFAITLTAYELLIRRIPPLRVFFGLRLRRLPASARAVSRKAVLGHGTASRGGNDR